MKITQIMLIIVGLVFSFTLNAQESTTEEATSTTESTTQVDVPEAADDVEAPKSQNMEKIEVTGSHIKRIDVEGPSPVLILDREYLDKTGYNSVADVLRDTTVAGLGGTREAGLTGGAETGAATTSVRGMDADSVLVLLDGKRMPTIGGSTTVDLNLIPMAAIERVEVLKDGASAIYGSDALGGVINFITKKNYDGASISMNFAQPEAVGGQKTDVTGTYGKSTSSFDILAVLNYRKNESVGMRDRDFFIPPPEAFSGSGSPGSYKNVSDPSTAWKAGGGADPCTGTVLDNGKCAFDYSPYMNVIPEIEQYSGLVNTSLKLAEGMRAFGRVVYTHRKVRSQLAPPPDSFTDETDIEGINTQIPQATATGEWGLAGVTEDIDVVYRLVEEVGARINETKSDSYGVSTGVKGQVWDTWDWEVSANYSQTKTTNRGISGYANKQTLFDLAKQSPTGFNPFAAPGSKSDISSAKYVPQLIIDSNIGGLLLQGTGEIIDMPAGPLAVAVGTSANWQTFEQSADSVTASGAQWGGGTSAEGVGRRDFQSAYMEFSIPPFTGMEVQLAGRFDNYSDFGSVVNPKVGFRYTPLSWLMLRGSWGTGFKAPALDDLYGGQTVGFPFGTDPVTGASAQYKTIGGGNTKLKEETSESLNVGFIAQILKNLAFGADYYTNNQKDVVSSGTLRDIFTAESAGIDLSQYNIQIIRNPAVTGAVDRIIAPQMNLSTRDTEGLEFKITHNMRLFGNWTMHTIIDHSVILKLDEEPFPGLGKEKRAGFAGNPYWRNNVNVNFGDGTYGLSLLAKTIGEQNYSALSPGTGGKTRDHTELDIQTQYMSSWKGMFSLGIRNVFNTDRPFMAEHLSNGFLNTSLYDPFGRTVFLGYTQDF